jgi:hypothetical protein
MSYVLIARVVFCCFMAMCGLSVQVVAGLESSARRQNYFHEYPACAADKQLLSTVICPEVQSGVVHGEKIAGLLAQTSYGHECAGATCRIMIHGSSFDANLYKGSLSLFAMCLDAIKTRDSSAREIIKNALSQLAKGLEMPVQSMVDECPCRHISQQDRTLFELDIATACGPRNTFSYVNYGPGLFLGDLIIVTDCVVKNGCKKVTLSLVDPAYKGFVDFLRESAAPIKLSSLYSQEQQQLLKSKKGGEHCPCRVNDSLFSLLLWLSWVCKIYDAEVDVRLYATTSALLEDHAMRGAAQMLISVDFDTVWPPCLSQKPHLGFPYVHWTDGERYCKEFFTIKDQILQSGGELRTLFGKDGKVIRQDGVNHRLNDDFVLHGYVENGSQNVVVLNNRFIITKESGAGVVRIGDSLRSCQQKQVFGYATTSEALEYFLLGKDREVGQYNEVQKHLAALAKQMNSLLDESGLVS